nr:hypothetical protein TSUD_88480 [Ipomoea batatas]
MPEIQAQRRREPAVRGRNFAGKRVKREVQGSDEVGETTQILRERTVEEIGRKVEMGERCESGDLDRQGAGERITGEIKRDKRSSVEEMSRNEVREVVVGEIKRGERRKSADFGGNVAGEFVAGERNRGLRGEIREGILHWDGRLQELVTEPLYLVQLFCYDHGVRLGYRIPSSVLIVEWAFVFIRVTVSSAEEIPALATEPGQAYPFVASPDCTPITSAAAAAMDSLGLLVLPLTMFSMDEAASLACSCFKIMSLWHLEHIFMVAALPKKPQLLTQKIGPSEAWQPVSFEDSIMQYPATWKHTNFIHMLNTSTTKIIDSRNLRKCTCGLTANNLTLKKFQMQSISMHYHK